MWDVAGLQEALTNEFGINLPVQQWLDEDDNLYEEKLLQKISGEISAAYNEKEKIVGAEGLRNLEKMIMLQTLDALWKEHLAAMDHLRQGIHLRGYAQKNPKQEYKREAFDLFNGMLTSLKHDVVTMLSRVQIRTQEEIDEAERRQRELAQQQEMELKHQGGVNSLAPESDNEPQAAAQAPVRRGPKVGRNDPCPCGSGKKYKQCHGKIA
jgi:preprotein translocase subunit SecA